MSDRITEGARFHNTDRGIVEIPRGEQGYQAHNPGERALARRRRLGTIAKTTAAVILGVGTLIGINEFRNATQKHDITPTGIGVGELVLKDDAKLLTISGDPGIADNTQVSWDQVTTSDGTPFSNYSSMMLENPPIREIPEPGYPYHTYAILDNVHVDGRTMDLAVDYGDPNLAHKLGNGFSDIGSFQITPDGKYQATYKGEQINPDQIGVIIPGEPK